MKIGITGGIASGKTTITTILSKLGAKILSADVIAKKVMMQGTDEYDDIVAHFGEEILDQKKEIDRAKLGEIIFENDTERHLLNNLTHPKIIEIIEAEMKDSIEGDMVAVEVPLLVEADMILMFDRIIVVTTTPETQLERLLEKGLSEKEALKRIRAQVSNEERYLYADYIVINKSNYENLRKDVEDLYSKLKGLDG